MKYDRKPSRPNRYDVSGNIEARYIDPEQTVMANKKGITDLPTLEVEEERALAHAYRTLLAEVLEDTPMSVALIRHIHETVFGELYEWAGRWRSVVISKPGTTWPPPAYLDASMQQFEREVLWKYPISALRTDDAFVHAAAEIQGEFLAIHPFREGNARTIKLLVNLMALQTGRPLLAYDESPEGRERYIEAAKAAILMNYDLLEDVIRQALHRARGEPEATP